MLDAAANTSTLLNVGPIIAAVGSFVVALVAWFSRKDRRSTDVAAGIDARTNTALKGLTEAYDRVEAERARQEQRADAAESRADLAEEHVRDLEEQLRRRRPR